MNIVISIHIFPSELMSYRRTLEQLSRNNITKSFILFVTLNLNSDLIDWGKTKNTKKNIIGIFEKINSDFPNLRKLTIISSDKKDKGVNTHRIITYKKFRNFDYILFLDVDVVFSDQLIESYLNAFYELNDKKGWYIITPEVLRLWDSTWDCIVNKKFINDELNSYKTKDIYKVHYDFKNENKKLRKSSEVKFAGGWFTCFQPNLLNFIEIPSSFGGYDSDDTYIIMCAKT